MNIPLNETYKLISSNSKYDFYLKHVRSTWYVYVLKKGTTEFSTCAGFTTKRTTLEVISHWMEAWN